MLGHAACASPCVSALSLLCATCVELSHNSGNGLIIKSRASLGVCGRVLRDMLGRRVRPLGLQLPFKSHTSRVVTHRADVRSACQTWCRNICVRRFLRG